MVCNSNLKLPNKKRKKQKSRPLLQQIIQKFTIPSHEERGKQKLKQMQENDHMN